MSQTRKIHNGKASLRKSHLIAAGHRIDLLPAVIWASVVHRVIHLFQLFQSNSLFSNVSAYSAHITHSLAVEVLFALSAHILAHKIFPVLPEILTFPVHRIHQFSIFFL